MQTIYDIVGKRLANLLSVKSLVTLIATGVFAYQEITSGVSQEFMIVYTVIIGFYFTYQDKKKSDTEVK